MLFRSDKDENEFGETRIIEDIKKNKEKSVSEIKKALMEALRAFSNFKINKDD